MKPQITRGRPLVLTPHTRGAISHAVSLFQKWRGTRKGVKMELTLSPPSMKVTKRVYWRARVPKSGRYPAHWANGAAGTVYDALNEIERAVMLNVIETTPPESYRRCNPSTRSQLAKLTGRNRT